MVGALKREAEPDQVAAGRLSSGSQDRSDEPV
jgi:hypothetical protein